MSGLFGDLPELREPRSEEPVSGFAGAGNARLRVPLRDEVRLEVVDLDALIGEDHAARLIWAYVERLDFSDFEAKVRSREGLPGMPQTMPHLLLALWLYAISDGVGSAREIERLCAYDPAYRWLCGGVTVNHHALSDFRSREGLRMDMLLAQHVASLSTAGLINLDEIAQDGVKVRANAGAASFRRRKTLANELAKAKALVARLAKDEDDDPGRSSRRRKARQASAAKERLARVEEALAALGEAEALRGKREKTNKAETARQKEPRASTSDAQARVMKMPDGGFRPAYNVQFASLPQSGIVVGVQVTSIGSDRGLAEPMAQKIVSTFGRRPLRHLLDGGYQSAADIEAADAAGTLIYSPPLRSKSGKDPHLPCRDDGPGVAAWRQRMATPAALAIYKRRSRCELVHAKLRNLRLDRLFVRGRRKVETWMTGFALAMNILTEARLRTTRAV
jgi:transposase